MVNLEYLSEPGNAVGELGHEHALLPDDLWAIVEPLLPAPLPTPKGSRPRIPDHACLTGILFVLKPGITWEYLPQEMGSGVTCAAAPDVSGSGYGLGWSISGR